jgi:dipeptidyl-peptidase 4
MAPLLCALVLANAPAAPAPAPLDPFLVRFAETRGFRAGRPGAVRLTPDGAAALFLRSGPRERTQSLFETDLATGATAEIASAAAVAGGAGPSAAEAARLERQRIMARGITGYALSRDGRRVVFGAGGHTYVLERATRAIRRVAGADGAIDARPSPDGRAVAFVKDRDLHVADLATGKVRRLTRARAPGISNGLAEFVAQEEMDRSRGYWWSPDARRLAVAEVDEGGVERWPLCDPARPDRGCTPIAYPRAGRANARVRLLVVPSAGGPAVPVRWDAEMFPYLYAVRWDDGPLAVVVENREQNEACVLEVDPATGATRLLHAERDPAWVTLSQEFPRFRRDGSFYWLTERNGGPEVELRDRRGALVRSVVPPALGFVDLAGYDRAEDTLVFIAAPDPTQTVLWRVRGEGVAERLDFGERGPALRRATIAERGGSVAVTWTTLRSMDRVAVFAGDGRRLAELPAVGEEPPFEPTTELRRVGAGEGLYAAVLRPRGLAPGERRPVVVDVYGGPSEPLAVRAPMIADQWLADQGFIVVRVDGRGTTRRGRAFSKALRGDFSETVLEDQIAGLRALAAEVPEMDLGRVGITGWSFGGYAAALAVMRRPDVFRAAVAGAAVAEWRDYDTYYTERYLGTPERNRAGYDRSSLLSWAPGLSRPLLVLHGTADDNVWFSHALKLADAAFRAGREVQLVPIAGATHMVPDPAAAARRLATTAAFLARHLGGPDPAVTAGSAPGRPPASP